MRCGRISVEGEAEEIAISPGPRSLQKHGKRPNPYSTIGLDKFESVCAELSAKREYIAKEIGTPEALVRFVDSKNGWIPVVVRPGEVIQKKNSTEGAAGVSILGPVEMSNDVTHEQKHYDNFKARKFIRVVPSHRFTRPARPVEGFHSFYRRTSPAMAYDARLGAAVMIITLLCLVFYGRLCTILLWLYVLARFRKN